MKKKIFILAGEKSGDLLGSFLIKALQKIIPDFSFVGVGGPEMRNLDFQAIKKCEDFEMFGFSDILFSFPKLRRQFNSVHKYIIESKPEAVVFIDYPGFNLRMAKKLKEWGYGGKIIQYISPTVWAWGAKRKVHMSKNLDLLLTIFPFEKEHFNDTNLNVKYVGHPIIEIIQKHQYDINWYRIFGIKNPDNLIAMFPGSRRSEIELNLPIQLNAALMLKKDNPNLIFIISCASEKIMPLIHNKLHNTSLTVNKDIFLLPKAYSFEIMRDSRSAIAKSGTVTLELAMHKRPTVVMYKLSFLNKIIAKYLLRLNLPHYCIVNILSKKTVFPEIIEKGLTPKSIYDQIKKLHFDTPERSNCIEDCNKIPEILKENNASIEAATAIRDLIS